MYSVWAAAALGAICFWLILLTYLYLRQWSFLKQLFPKNDSRDIRNEASFLLRNRFKEVTEAISGFEKDNKILQNKLIGVIKDGLGNLQKIAVLKYNPFEETGGDQSFSLALLNGKLDGVVITSLHSRSGTRIYLKDIKSGKSELELSKEEAQVLKKAIET